MSDRPTPLTDEAIRAADGQWTFLARDLSRRLELDRAALMEALEAIANRHVIAGSTGDYRQGQLDALAACRNVSIAALASARANFPES